MSSPSVSALHRVHLSRALLPLALAGLLLAGLAVTTAPVHAAERLSHSILTRTSEAAKRIERLHTLVVAEQGEIVLEQTYNGPPATQPVNIKSLSKTVLAALTGAAIADGLITGVDQPVVELLGPLVPDDSDPRVEEITVGHLLSLQAGLEPTSGRHYGGWVASRNWVANALSRPFVDRPGGEMLYSTGSSHILSAALTQASGESTLALARRLLGEPLGITLPAWPRDPQGIYFGGNDMALSPHALIALGELYRHDGKIGDTRVLPEGWVEASWQPRGTSRWTGDRYGYGWFITTLEDTPVYYGRGFGGQGLYVIPARALTVVFTADPHPDTAGQRFSQEQLHRIVSLLLQTETQNGT